MPIVVNTDEEWEVDEVLASRLRRGQLSYCVRWTGYDPDPKWYPAWNLAGAPQKLRQFHTTYPKKPGPPKYLQEWLDAWETEDEPVKHDDINSVLPKPEGRLRTRRG